MKTLKKLNVSYITFSTRKYIYREFNLLTLLLKASNTYNIGDLWKLYKTYLNYVPKFNIQKS